MRDTAPPLAGAVDDASAPVVDPFVLAGTTIWLVVFGWYVLLQAAPRAGLSLSVAALVYASAALIAGVCFGWGEDRVATPIRRVADPLGLVLGATVIVLATLTWFVLAAPASPTRRGSGWVPCSSVQESRSVQRDDSAAVWLRPVASVRKAVHTAVRHESRVAETTSTRRSFTFVPVVPVSTMASRSARYG